MKSQFSTLLISIALGIVTMACESDASYNPGSGQGGSMARFAISEDHLYIVTPSKLIPYDISDPILPELQPSIELGRDIETIFPYQDHLFIGAETGMHIYNIADPAEPKHISSYQHVRSCDPVVVQGNYAYVTLRANNICGGISNVLEVIDITNLKNPTLAYSHWMYSPHGLGIDGAKLFVCEGDYGLVYFDATDPVNVTYSKTYENHSAYDLIMRGGHMIVTGKDGVYQYDYSSADTLVFLSKIDIVSHAL